MQRQNNMNFFECKRKESKIYMNLKEKIKESIVSTLMVILIVN